MEPQSNSFLKEGKLLFQPSFWSSLAGSALVGRAGLGHLPLCLLLSRRSCATLSPGCIPVHRWNERDGDSSVLSLADVTTSSPKTSLCFFFSILMHASIFLAEENQLMQAYAKSRKKRLFDQEMGLSLAVGFLSLCYWNKIYISD